jgi:ketosteroid isomerase-like protein
MSRENVEALRRVHDQMTRGNFWALAPLLDDAVEWEWGRGYASLVGGPKTYRGIKEVEAATKEWLAAWEWFTIDADEFIDAGEHVVVLTRYHARPRRGGPQISERAAEVWTWREGKIVRHRSYRDRAEALQAVGLRE